MASPLRYTGGTLTLESGQTFLLVLHREPFDDGGHS